jgi:hypothetical protein
VKSEATRLLISSKDGVVVVRDLFSKKWVQVSLLLVTSFVVLWPVIPSAFSADDTFDSFIPFQLSYGNISPWTFISNVTQGWMTNQGRFFPGAVTVSTFAHYFFPGRLGYKSLQLTFALIALGMFYLFVRTLIKNHHIAILTSLIALGAMQFKVQYDPLLHFSLQQPTLIISVFTAVLFFILGVRRNSGYLLIASALSFSISLLTYETSVLLWPIFAFVLIQENPEKWRVKLASTVIAPIIAGINLVYLRGQVEVTAPGYTSNFDLEPLVRTFGKQLLASIPMSYTEVNAPDFIQQFPTHLQIQTWYWWIAVLSSLVISALAIRVLPDISLRTRISMIGIGLTLWVTPALVVAQTVRWQGELVLGNGYITAYQGYFGFALIAVGVLLQIRSWLRKQNRRVYQIICLVFLFIVFSSISSSTTNNRLAVAQYNPGYLWPREHFEKAIETGTFDLVQSGTSLFSTQPEWWFNAPLIKWFGGPRLDELINPRDAQKFQDCLDELNLCKERQSLSYAFNSYGIFPNDTRATVVGQLERFTENEDSLDGVIVSEISIFVEYPTKSSSVNDSDTRCRSWLSSRLETQGLKISPSQVKVQRVTVSSCNATLPSNFELNLLKFNP